MQLAVLLYPNDLFNEMFLVKIRECILNLNEKHPLKKWLKTLAADEKPNKKEQEKINFLNEMLNSPFNLITDQKIKTEVISLLGDIKGNTNLEKLLQSYLYLMIGNVTQSDNILKSIVQQSPREFYQRDDVEKSIYHEQTKNHLEKVLRKFSRHPADRLSFYLFTMYLKNYLNQSELLALIEDIEKDELKSKLGLAYTESLAPDLVKFLRLTRMSEKRRIKNLRSSKFPINMQSYWVWPFMDVDPLISEDMVSQVLELDKKDPLWSVFLLDNERLADLYLKKGGIPLAKRRQFLRNNLHNKKDFMLSLYKLIEIGDINEDLVEEVLNYP